MDRIHEKIAALPPNANYFSLEFFPPKTAQGFANLRARSSSMSPGAPAAARATNRWPSLS
jgi:methylenetetrahydrofolate reductase (NADPH)